MADIARTRIGTSDPVDICKGFFLFGGGVSLGFNPGLANDLTIFNKRTQMAAWKLFLRSQVQLTSGLCGPSYGTVFDVRGSTTGQSITLTQSNAQSAAGMVMGLGASAEVSLNLRQYKVRFKKGRLKGKWSNAIKISVTFAVDVIPILIAFIRSLLGSGGETEAEDTDLKVGRISGYSFVSRTASTFGGSGTIFMRPAFTQMFDITDKLPGLPAVKKAIKKVKGNFKFGPIIGLAIPVTVEAESVKLSGGGTSATYRKPSGSSSLAINGVFNGTTTDTVPANPDTIEIELRHEPTFDVILGIGASVSVAKVFSFSVKVEVGLADAFGAFPPVVSQTNKISNSVGSNFANVIFEPPAEVLS